MGWKKTLKKGLIGGMSFAKDAGKINWFPGHMASATRAIRNRLKLSDLVIEVRDARVRTHTLNTIFLFESIIIVEVLIWIGFVFFGYVADSSVIGERGPTVSIVSEEAYHSSE